MIIGVLKEIKVEEYRVGLTPESVRSLIEDGNKVFIEKDAGIGSGFLNKEYIDAGAEIATKEEIFNSAELIIKVKEPQMSEIELFKPGQILFTFFHFASNLAMTRALVNKKVTCIAYELIEENGKRPILAPMSEIAGKLSIQQGMKYLEKPSGGKGILLTGTKDVEPGRVVVLGGGVVGTAAADVAYKLGAKLTIIEKDSKKREILKQKFPEGHIFDSNPDIVIGNCKKADIVIGAVLIPGHKPPVLIKKNHLKYLESGTVFVDVSIDEGGVFESSRPTTHKEPTFIEEGIVHYCVPNMPGIVPKTSTIALNAASISYAKLIAKHGESAVRFSDAIKKGCVIIGGKVISAAIEEILKSEN